MWFKILYSKLMYWWTQHYHPDATRTHQRYGALTALDPMLFTRYRTTTGCVYFMNVLYTDLSRYTQNLQQVCRLLELNTLIENHWCDYTYQRRSLDSFFIDRNHRYLDPAIEVARFKVAALHFVTLYTTIEHAQLDNEGHNARILSKFEAHLLTLTEDLLAYSHTCT